MFLCLPLGVADAVVVIGADDSAHRGGHTNRLRAGTLGIPRYTARALPRSFGARLAITIAISALFALGIALAIPEVARRRAIAAIEARGGPGTTASILDVQLGREAVRVVGLDVRAEGVRIQAESVTLRASLWALATDGTRGVHAVTVEGGRVEVDLASASLARWRGGDASDASSSSPGTTRTIEARSVALTVRDGDDVLASSEGIDAHWDGTTLSVEAHGVALGQDTIDHATIEAARTDGAMRLVSASLGRVVVSADTAEGEGAVARLVRRAREVAASGASGAGTGEGEAGHRSRLDAIESRLDASFRASVDDLTIRRTVDGEARPLVTRLHASISRTSESVYTTEGEGSPEGGGSLGWDLDVAPHLPTAHGSVTLDRVALAAFVPFLPASIPFSQPERARVSGHLALTSSSDDHVHAEGTVALEDLAFEHARIAATPVRGIALSLHGAADLTPSADRVAIRSLVLAMGGAQATLDGAIEWADDHYLFDLHAALPRTDCDVAVHAIPRDLLGDLVGFRLSGAIAASVNAHVDSRDLPHTTLQFRFANACEFVSFPPMADVARFTQPFEHHVEEPDGTTFEMETGPGTEAWTPIAEISPFLVHAVLAHEDASFFDHEGFAPWAIREALIRDLQAGRYVAGGSTITMQLVKNVFLHREKTLARKVQEVLLTWWLETQLEKEQILELYLNVIEYGPSVYGIRHAAQHYFGRSPSDLSPAESAFLALILPNPPQFHEMYDEGAIPRAFRNRIASFVRICGSRGRYDEAAVADGVAEAETLSFHREGDPPPATREIQGAVAPLPIQFFATVPLARLQASADGADADGADDGTVVDPWDDESGWDR